LSANDGFLFADRENFSGRHFDQAVLIGQRAIFCFSAFQYLSAVGDTQLNGSIQGARVGTGLTS